MRYTPISPMAVLLEDGTIYTITNNDVVYLQMSYKGKCYCKLNDRYQGMNCSFPEEKLILIRNEDLLEEIYGQK